MPLSGLIALAFGVVYFCLACAAHRNGNHSGLQHGMTRAAVWIAAAYVIGATT